MIYLLHINTDDDCDLIIGEQRYPSGVNVIIKEDTFEKQLSKLLTFLFTVEVDMSRGHSKDMRNVLDRTIEYFNYNSSITSLHYYRGGNRYIEISEYELPIEI